MATALSEGLSFNDAATQANDGVMPEMLSIVGSIALNFEAENHPNASIILQESLNAGADINAYMDSWNHTTQRPLWAFHRINILKETSDILLNSGEKSLSPNRFLHLVSKASELNEGSFSEKQDLLKMALKAGADITSYINNNNASWGPEFLTIAKDVLLKGEKPLLPLESFLKLVMKSHASNADQISQKIALLHSAIEAGADINAYINNNDVAWDLEFLTTAKDVLLQGEKPPLSPDSFLILAMKSYTYDEKTVSQKIALLQTAIEAGADINAYIQNNYIVSQRVEFVTAAKESLLQGENHPLSPVSFLKLVIGISGNNDNEISQKIALLHSAIEAGADINAYINNNDVAWDLEFLTTAKDVLLQGEKPPLSPDSFLILAMKSYTYDEKTVSQKIALLQTAIEAGADINAYVTDKHVNWGLLFLHKATEALLDKEPALLSPDSFLTLIAKNINYAEETQQHPRISKEEAYPYRLDLLNKAVTIGADLNKMGSAIVDGEHLTFFEGLLIHGQYGLMHALIEAYPDRDFSIRPTAYIEWMTDEDRNTSALETMRTFLSLFPDMIDVDMIYARMRFEGMSHVDANGVLDIYHLARDMQASIVLSQAELSLLDPAIEPLPIEEYREAAMQNRYGYTPLQLAILGIKLEVARIMLEKGFSVTEQNDHGYTALHMMISTLPSHWKASEEIKGGHNTLLRDALEQVDAIDMPVHVSGTTLMDNFIDNEELKEQALGKTHDPLYDFLKPGADLMAPSHAPEKIYIAIAKGDWSSSLNSLSRLLTAEHPNVVFHMVTLEMVEKGGEDFIRQFNGWMNPGSNDRYPTGRKDFTFQDITEPSDTDTLYQHGLKGVVAHDIPYIGMCGGAQHLVMHHGGSLTQKGYDGKKPVYYLKGTVAHFMTLTEEQQHSALRYCELPEISVEVTTAHGYSAVPYKLGNGMELGAISTDGVPMSYAHRNGLHYATQFHPEHVYHQKGNETHSNHQRVWLDNWVKLASLHNEAEMGRAMHPKELFVDISARLAECMEAPTSLTDGMLSHNATIHAYVMEHWIES